MEEYPRCVLVSLSTNKSNNGDGFGTSGIFLSNEWILSHGTLLSPNFFESSAYDIRNFLSEVGENIKGDLVNVPLHLTETMKLQLQYNRIVAVTDEATRKLQQTTIEEKNCSLRVIWRCSLLHKTFGDLLAWSFEKDAKFDKSLLSIFLLLKVETEAKIGKDDAAEGMKVLSDFYKKQFRGKTKGPSLTRGAPVEIVGVPFGNAVFLDSITRGVVSNIFGESGCLFLTDANAVPGCEGAPIFVLGEPEEDREEDREVDREVDRGEDRRQICGMVIAPLSWCRGEWVDYTFAANLQPCLEKVLRVPDAVALTSRGSCVRRGTKRMGPLLPDLLNRSVVVVKCGFGWGTGIVVDVPTGTILTCSHVVREALGSRVKVALFEDTEEATKREENEEMWARLVYRTKDGQPYDVAVLRLERRRDDLRALRLAEWTPDKGSRVMALGFPFFPTTAATCSNGVISRQTVCMLQTTCCVQSGASGGPVVSCSTGEMLGLIVSNAISDNDSGVLYPRFNMAVPSTVIREPLSRYIETGDVTCLESLSSKNQMVQKTWNFYLNPRSKM